MCRRIAEGEKAKPKAITLARLVELYLAAQRAQDRAPKTINKYTRVLEAQLAPWAHEQGVRLARDFRERHFWAFAETRSHLATKTRYTELTVVKQLFGWGQAEGLLAENPIARCRVREPEPTEQHCFTPEQVALMLQRADDYLRPIIRLLAQTGLRIGELRDLEWGDVDLKSGANGFIIVRRGGSGDTTKSKRSRLIPLHPDARAELEALPRVAGSDLVFHARPTKKDPRPTRPLDPRRILQAIKLHAKRCGFADWRRARTHSFRHFFASELARHGVAEYTARALMGQRSSDVLRLYLHPHDGDAERAISRLDMPHADLSRESDRKTQDQGRSQRHAC